MILYHTQFAHLINEPGFEDQVRYHMTLDGLDQEKYPYMVTKSHPEPEHLRLWLKDQFGHKPHSYVVWKGWIMLQDHADAVSVMLTWCN